MTKHPSRIEPSTGRGERPAEAQKIRVDEGFARHREAFPFTASAQVGGHRNPDLLSLDWGLRGATGALALLLAGAILRDFGRSIARLAAAFAVGTAAYAASSAFGFRPSPGLSRSWHCRPATMSSSGCSPRPCSRKVSACAGGIGALWFVLTAAGSVACLLPSAARPSDASGLLNLGLVLSSLVFAIAAIGSRSRRGVPTWSRAGADASFRRRRPSAYIGLTALFQLGRFVPRRRWDGAACSARWPAGDLGHDRLALLLRRPGSVVVSGRCAAANVLSPIAPPRWRGKVRLRPPIPP